MIFLVALFLIKNGFIFKDKNILGINSQSNGLVYGNITVEGLVNKDTDQDGVLDWEEPLWGLDPTKKETVPGVPDITTVNKMKAQEGIGENNSSNDENLTETDKFARELFSTVAALNQNGEVNQETADKISSSLAEKIQNPIQKKVFSLADINVIQDDSVTAVKKYNSTLDNIHSKYPVKNNVMEIFQQFIIDENNVDVSVLEKLSPIIKQTQGVLNEMQKVNVPVSLTSQHLNYINELQKFSENLSAIQFFDKDPIIALGGISNLEENITLIESAVKELSEAIQKKIE